MPSKMEIADAVSLLSGKESQFYALWAVYTAVQFSAGSFALSQYNCGSAVMPTVLGLSVCAGVWAFNIGHLLFVLECLFHISKLKAAIHGLAKEIENDLLRKAVLATASTGISKVISGELKFTEGGYFSSIFVHLFIDTCATVALLSRVNHFSFLCRV